VEMNDAVAGRLCTAGRAAVSRYRAVASQPSALTVATDHTPRSTGVAAIVEKAARRTRRCSTNNQDPGRRSAATTPESIAANHHQTPASNSHPLQSKHLSASSRLAPCASERGQSPAAATPESHVAKRDQVAQVTCSFGGRRRDTRLRVSSLSAAVACTYFSLFRELGRWNVAVDTTSVWCRPRSFRRTNYEELKLI